MNPNYSSSLIPGRGQLSVVPLDELDAFVIEHSARSDSRVGSSAFAYSKQFSPGDLIRRQLFEDDVASDVLLGFICWYARLDDGRLAAGVLWS